jgi:diguanylate cyclase (GGDEF)-like protein/PAS domain S-box-containing protein
LKPFSFPVTVLVVNGEGRVLSASPSGEDLFRLTPAELEGLPVSALVQVADGKHFRPFVFRPEESDFHGIVMAGKGEHGPMRVMVASHRLDDVGNDRYSIIFTPCARAGVSGRSPSLHDAPFMDFIECLPGVFYGIDENARLILWNRRLRDALGVPELELPGIDVERFFDPDELELVRRNIAEAFQSGRSSHEAILVSADGRRTPHLFNCSRTTLGAIPCVFGTGLDITARREAENRLLVRERAMYSSTSAIVITCCKGRDHLIEYVNPAFERMTGYSLEECKGRDPRFMEVEGLDREQRQRIRAALDSKQGIVTVLRNKRKSGEVFLNELRIDPVVNSDGSVSHFVGVLDDVTEERQYERRLRHAANHDPLTGLANRSLLREQTEHAVEMAAEYGHSFAIALLDLDNFKVINDSYGHAAGDAVLTEVADRLRGQLEPEDTIARLGGDEFVLVVRSRGHLEELVELMERIRQAIGEPMVVDAGELNTAVSIGVSVYPQDASDAEGLMRAADAAMYRAKTLGRNNCQLYADCAAEITPSRA